MTGPFHVLDNHFHVLPRAGSCPQGSSNPQVAKHAWICQTSTNFRRQHSRNIWHVKEKWAPVILLMSDVVWLLSGFLHAVLVVCRLWDHCCRVWDEEEEESVRKEAAKALNWQIDQTLWQTTSQTIIVQSHYQPAFLILLFTLVAAVCRLVNNKISLQIVYM